MGEMIGATARVKIPRSWVTFEKRETWRGSGKFYDQPSLREPAEDNNDPDDPLRALHNLADNFGDYLDVNDIEGQPDAVILTMQGALNYGWYSCDEDRGGALLRLRIPFWAQSDAKYEYDGAVEWYDGNPEGTLGTSVSANNDGEPYLTRFELQAIFDSNGGDLTSVGDAIAAWLDGSRFDLEACDISHLIP